MKNLHLIPTEKPSRLYKQTGALVLDKLSEVSNDGISINQHLYITSDEEIKEGDWVIAIEGIWKNTITKITGTPITDVWRKIILTTDYDLIKDGVQVIDDEFLEWFVKNPSCEFVEVQDMSMQYHEEDYHEYKIIIPQEEAKQETLEGAADRLAKKYGYYIEGGKVADFVDGVVRGAEWQAERMYSEEGVLKILRQFNKDKPKLIFGVEEWFEQFKKK